MSFLYPNVLWLMLLPLLLAVAALLLRRNRGQAWRKLVSAAHLETLAVRRPLWNSVLPAVLALLAMGCIILALARPINGYRETSATDSGRNLLIALDISRSMETQDVKPSRLEEARAAAYELIGALPTDKIGLIVFSGEADLVVPLTYDHTALRDALEQVNRGWAGAGGTNFGRVLRKAMQDFKRSAPEGTNALVILSDGEDTVDSSLEIAEEAKKSGLLVITVGIGTEAGGAIPDERGENGLWQDANGKHVISKLNPKSLQDFAKATGGSFFAMTANANLAEFARSAVQKLDKHEEAHSISKTPNDLFRYFAVAALLLVVISILTRTAWKAPKLTAGLLLAGLFCQQETLAAPSLENIGHYQIGLNLLDKEPDKAREAFSRALLDEDKELQAASLYELGNINTRATLEELRALYEAPADNAGSPASPGPEELQSVVDSLKNDISSYKDALSIQPGLKPASTNLSRMEEFIKKLEEEIERLKQQQNQQQDSQDKQNQEQQQDSQDKQNQDNQQDSQDKQNQDNQQDSQDKQNQDKQQDSQDKQNQDKQQDSQDKQNQDKQQDSQDKQNQDKQQDSQDKQNQDNQQDSQDKQNQDKQQDSQDKQNQDKQQDSQDKQNQDKQQEEQQAQSARAEQQELSDEEKARQRAASILKMHMDEEQGSPIPHANDNVRPPAKDY